MSPVHAKRAGEAPSGRRTVIRILHRPDPARPGRARCGYDLTKMSGAHGTREDAGPNDVDDCLTCRWFKETT